MKRLVILVFLSGCASTPVPEVSHDQCLQQGGVWFKSGMDIEYRCVDKASLMDSFRLQLLK